MQLNSQSIWKLLFYPVFNGWVRSPVGADRSEVVVGESRFQQDRDMQVSSAKQTSAKFTALVFNDFTAIANGTAALDPTLTP